MSTTKTTKTMTINEKLAALHPAQARMVGYFLAGNDENKGAIAMQAIDEQLERQMNTTKATTLRKVAEMHARSGKHGLAGFFRMAATSHDVSEQDWVRREFAEKARRSARDLLEYYIHQADMIVGERDKTSCARRGRRLRVAMEKNRETRKAIRAAL